MAFVLRTLGLFVVTAVAEIVGCYLPYLWLKQRASGWVLIPAALSLAATPAATTASAAAR